MAADNSADIITLDQPRPLTAAERAKAYRQRKKAKAQVLPPIEIEAEPAPLLPVPVAPAVTTVTPIVTPAVTLPVTPSRRPLPSILISIAAVGLTGVGIVMNGTFAHGLGATELSSWLFMAIGVAADLVALAVPSCAARLWQTRQRGTAAAAWLLWLAIFAFTTTAGIGFASVNISDVTLSRASRRP